MDLREIEWGDMDWVDVAQGRDSGEHDNEPSGCIKLGSS
jgi:hypothetical protein